MKVSFWYGDKARPAQIVRPCSCGCDEREGPMAGYYTRSDADGVGITVVYETEDEYQGALRMQRAAHAEADADAARTAKGVTP